MSSEPKLTEKIGEFGFSPGLLLINKVNPRIRDTEKSFLACTHSLIPRRQEKSTPAPKSRPRKLPGKIPRVLFLMVQWLIHQIVANDASSAMSTSKRNMWFAMPQGSLCMPESPHEMAMPTESSTGLASKQKGPSRRIYGDLEVTISNSEARV